MTLDPNFREFIASLLDAEVRFLVVGGYAVAMHGHPRYTGDLDVWVWVDGKNADGILRALTSFGFGDVGLEREDFLAVDRIVQLGYPPLRIDLLTGLDGIEFQPSFERREVVTIDGLEVPFIGRSDLIANKRASRRPQDLADLDALER